MPRVKKPAIQIDVPLVWVDDSFGLNHQFTCRLLGSPSAKEDTAEMRLMRSPASQEEVDIAIQVIGLAGLKRLWVHLGDFLAQMDSPEVH